MPKEQTHAQKPVLIFDMNETLLDLGELEQSVSKVLGGTKDTVSLWFETMLHYSMVDTVSGRYHDFGEIGAAALMMLAETRNITLNKIKASEALKPIRSAPPYPEVPKALEELKKAGYQMVVLTNSSTNGMKVQLSSAGIKHFFHHCLSVEQIKKYKPHRAVYEWAAKTLQTDPKNCLFIAAHGWDVAGAMAAGMRTAFIARPGQARYPLAAQPTFITNNLAALSEQLLAKPPL